MKFRYLNELAEIVVNIDENKNITDTGIVGLTDRSILLISHMKLLDINPGSLREIFVGMQMMCDNRAVLTELIDMAHEEISRLLGKDAWRVYGAEDCGGMFYQSDLMSEKAAA